MVEAALEVCGRIGEIRDYLFSVRGMQGTLEEYKEVLKELDQLGLEIVGLRGQIAAALIENPDDPDWKYADGRLDSLEKDFEHAKMHINDAIYQLTR